MCVSADLDQLAYPETRKTAREKAEIFPSYSKVLHARKECYSSADSMLFADMSAKVRLQDRWTIPPAVSLHTSLWTRIKAIFITSGGSMAQRDSRYTSRRLRRTILQRRAFSAPPWFPSNSPPMAGRPRPDCAGWPTHIQ